LEDERRRGLGTTWMKHKMELQYWCVTSALAWVTHTRGA
jgi:hypothetical protein